LLNLVFVIVSPSHINSVNPALHPGRRAPCEPVPSMLTSSTGMTRCRTSRTTERR